MQTHVVLPYIAALWRDAEYRDKLTTEVVHGENGVANTVLLPNVDAVVEEGTFRRCVKLGSAVPASLDSCNNTGRGSPIPRKRQHSNLILL